MIIQRLYSQTSKQKMGEEEVKKAVKKKAPKIEKGIIEKATEKGKEILKNPKTKKWGLIGAGALGGTMAVEGVNAGIKKIKNKKKETEAKEQILRGLKS